MNIVFPPLVLVLPILIMASYLFLLPAPLAPSARKRSMVTVLSTLLLTFGSCILLIRMNTHSAELNATRWFSASIAIFAASLVSAPKLDRARTIPLVIASSIIGIFMIPLLLHVLIVKLPSIGGAALLYTAIVASTFIGLGGSKQLSQPPARSTDTNDSRMFVGWLLVALVISTFGAHLQSLDASFDYTPLFISGAASALLCILRTRALRKIGESFAAGIVISIMSPYSPEVSVAVGVLAGYFVLRCEAMTNALKLDDPHHLIGTFMIPALFGLVLPAVGDMPHLTDHLVWVGAALTLGLAGTWLLWPLWKLTGGASLCRNQLN